MMSGLQDQRSNHPATKAAQWVGNKSMYMYMLVWPHHDTYNVHVHILHVLDVYLYWMYHVHVHVYIHDMYNVQYMYIYMICTCTCTCTCMCRSDASAYVRHEYMSVVVGSKLKACAASI